MGPGMYDPDRANGVTKPKIPNINMGSSPSRGSFIKKDDTNIGPGQYDDGKAFGGEAIGYGNVPRRVHGVMACHAIGVHD